jgi:uncharacterized membrane protein
MHNFLIWLLAKREGPCEIAFLSFFHILYLAIILALTAVLVVYLKRHPEKRTTALRHLSLTLIALYVSDIFLQPFVSSDFTMNIDKLPFHICTVLCPVSALVQFNRRFERFREPVSFLAIVGPLMYLVYPGTAIGSVSPFCYEIIQTFVFHGVLLAWGCLNISLGSVLPNIKNCYKALIGICMIAVWATIGNFTYGVPYNYSGSDPHFDWFFLTGSTFPFIPRALMPVVVICAVFLMVLAIYGIYYLVRHIENKKKGAPEEKKIEESATV